MSDDDYKSSPPDYFEGSLSTLLLYDKLHCGEAFFLFLNLDPIESYVVDRSYGNTKAISYSERFRRNWPGAEDLEDHLPMFDNLNEETFYDLCGQQITDAYEVHCLAAEFRRLRGIWRSKHTSLDDMQTVEYHINWAQSKHREIPWLESAAAKRYLSKDQLNPKKENQMLAIIACFAQGLGVIPSGAPRKDAKALLDVLASRGVLEPCESQTLAKYLPQEKYLPKE